MEKKRFVTKKSLGQHFLNNPKVPKMMAEAINVEEGDIVVEVGPGTGVLTQELLNKGATVVAIEADGRAIEELSLTFKGEIAAGKLVLLHADMRTFELSSLSAHVQPHKYKVVSNIPYYLSGMLFRTFLETPFQPSDLVFLVQKEVGERIVRDPKESLLSISIKVFGDPSYVKTVKRGNFNPPPLVDSAIIAIKNISEERLQGVSADLFFTILHAGFASKRKQLLGNLTKLTPRANIIPIFSTLGIKEDIRGEDLPVATWVSLVQKLSPNFPTK